MDRNTLPCLQTPRSMYSSIYNSFPVIRTTNYCKKSPFLRNPAFYFCLPRGRPGDNHAKRCMNEKTIQCLANPSHYVPIYLQQFPSYLNRKCKKSRFTYRSPHFCFRWRRPCDYHAICSMDGKTIQCLPNPSQHVPIYLQQFPSYTILKSMRKSKNRYFLQHFCFHWGRPWGNHTKCCMDGKRIRCLQIVLQHVPIYLQQFPSYSNGKCEKSPFSSTAAHIFVSPRDAPATIMQYVAWMERQFNACQTHRSMYLSIFNNFRVIRNDAYSMRKSKNRYFYHILFPLETTLGQSR